jgi:hypothetical protein
MDDSWLMERSEASQSEGLQEGSTLQGGSTLAGVL